MDILSLLDNLEHAIENGKKPFLSTDKVMVDPEELFRYIDQLRASVPQEIRDAQWIKKEEERIKSTALAERERILQETQAEVEALLAQSEIIRLAEERAKEIIYQANDNAREITINAFQYANDVMEKIEKQLTIYYDVIQDGKIEIQKTLGIAQENSATEL